MSRTQVDHNAGLRLLKDEPVLLVSRYSSSTSASTKCRRRSRCCLDDCPVPRRRWLGSPGCAAVAGRRKPLRWCSPSCYILPSCTQSRAPAGDVGMREKNDLQRQQSIKLLVNLPIECHLHSAVLRQRVRRTSW